jgi:hypothetical protein
LDTGFQSRYSLSDHGFDVFGFIVGRQDKRNARHGEMFL